MPLLSSEAIVLRARLLSEADRIVVLLTKEFGKLSAVARSARRFKGKFVGVLEPLSHIKVEFYERENRNLVYLNHCDLEESFFDLQSDYVFQVAGGYLIEVVDALLPEKEPSQKAFRLLLATLRSRRAGVDTLKVLAYFNSWILRLSGVFPVLDACSHCETDLTISGGRLFRSEQKVYCHRCRPSGGEVIENKWVFLSQLFAVMPLTKINALQGVTTSEFRAFNRFLESLVVQVVERKLHTQELLRELMSRGEL